MPGEYAIDEIIINPIENFKITTYYASIYCIHTQITERFIGQSGSNNFKNSDKIQL
jgi:hypothetical protein